MKILMINGQNHKGSTYHIGKQFIEKISNNAEVKEIFLPKDLNHFCMGCYNCITDETKCPFYEEKRVILQMIEEANILVFTSPTYCMGMSSPLKAFFDLFFDMWLPHRPKEFMFHKEAYYFATCAGAGAKATLKQIKTTLFYLGIPYYKGLGFKVSAMNYDGVSSEIKMNIDKATTKLAKKHFKIKKLKPSFKQKFMFNIMGLTHKKGWDSSPVEKEYWDKMGWLKKNRPWKNKNRIKD